MDLLTGVLHTAVFRQGIIAGREELLASREERMESGHWVRLCLRRPASVLVPACQGLTVLEWLGSPG